MGVAILSGVFESLNSPAKSLKNGASKWESHTPGTLTPTGPPDATVPSRFLACVRRAESAEKLRRTFGAMGELGQSVEVLASQNVEGVASSDVVLLW
jgi:pyrroline-5-carboxylate reductase